MERKTYLGRYQITLDERGEPMVLERGASSVTLRGEDKTANQPVVIEVVRPGPLQQVPLDQVEADARAAQQLDHINIARVRDFGFEEGDIVYVREFLDGSTLDVWVRDHGPLPVAAVMRIALQGVNALAAAAFQNITHRAIQPASLMIVPGQTPEGDWPLVKILNFGSLAPTFSRNGFTTTGPGELALFASPEQLKGATPDFKSDIYSLGATLWFLLTGAAPRVGMVERSRGIPKNVAAVISRMLASNPDQRPHDPLVLQEEIRACLGRAERRESIGRRFGFGGKAATAAVAAAPVIAAATTAAPAAAAPTVAAPASPAAPAPPPLAAMAPAESLPEELEPEADPIGDVPAAAASPASVGRFLLRPLAWAAVLLTIGAIAAMILPGAIRTVQNWQAEKEPEAIGVKVGVPDATANALAANPAPQQPAAPATETQTAAAAAAPEVSPPQDTAVAANRTAPAAAASPSFPSAGTSAADTQSQPAVAAAPTTSVPDASPASDTTTTDRSGSQANEPTVAYMNNGGATQNSTQPATTTQRTEPATSSTGDAPVVAANTSRPAAQTSEPAAPAEGPDDSAAQAQSNRQSRSTAQRNTQSETTVAQTGKTASASAEGERRPATRSTSTSKSRTKTASRTGLTAEEQTELEVRQALPVTPEDERALPPVPRGSKRARYLGTTPDGALVFGMPSNERVFVSPPPPPGSPRRIIRRALPDADAPPPRAEPVDPAELEQPAPPDEDEE